MLPCVSRSKLRDNIRGSSYVRAILTDQRIKKVVTTVQQTLVPAESVASRDHKPRDASLQHDARKGTEIATILYEAFRTTGIHGMRDMPEDTPPQGIALGSPDHIIFLTLTVAIDYQRDAPALWDAARETWEDPETRYLFDPHVVSTAPLDQVVGDMKKHRLSKKHTKDTKIWRAVAESFAQKWGGDPRNFLADCGEDAPTILRRLKEDRHRQDGEIKYDFPYLGGDKIGPLWLRMLRDNAGVATLKNLDQVPIPVDVHIARASLCLGMVNGTYSGRIKPIFQEIRDAWAESVKGLEVAGRPMIALDVDEPLWHLSKYGCKKYRDQVSGACPKKKDCVVGDYCIPGEVRIYSKGVVVNTTSQNRQILCVISCGGKKIWDEKEGVGPTPARDVYISHYVQGNQRYAEVFYPDDWCILSAKHGFLLPGDIVKENYRQRMGKSGSIPIPVLREQAIKKGLDHYDEIVVLAGMEYVGAVREACPNQKVRALFAGVGGIGKQMAAVRRAMEQGCEL